MTEPHLLVDIAAQSLELREGGRIVRRYRVSTAANGVGERSGSGCTPLGWHRVRARIGDACPEGTVFVGRRATGEVYSPELAAAHPDRDWILTRILWLTGEESGRNRGGEVDTLRRYIYIHGTPDDQPMGVARSHGCVRMRPEEVVELFDLVPAGTPVEIV